MDKNKNLNYLITTRLEYDSLAGISDLEKANFHIANFEVDSIENDCDNKSRTGAIDKDENMYLTVISWMSKSSCLQVGLWLT